MTDSHIHAFSPSACHAHQCTPFFSNKLNYQGIVYACVRALDQYRFANWRAYSHEMRRFYSAILQLQLWLLLVVAQMVVVVAHCVAKGCTFVWSHANTNSNSHTHTHTPLDNTNMCNMHSHSQLTTWINCWIGDFCRFQIFVHNDVDNSI